MLTGPRFARASYILFTIAALAALMKLGGIAGVEPFILRTAPATTVARAAEPVVKEDPADVRLDLPERRYTLGGRLLPELINSPDVASNEAPVFYRPTPTREAESNSSEPVCTDLSGFPEGSRAMFPLPGDYFGSYEDTWRAARSQGGHEGTDLMSQAGTPEFAITDGTIVRVSGANRNGWNRLGGYTVMLKAAYDVGPIKKGDLFYYAHLNEESSLPIGTKVKAGQRMGFAGDTGEGREGTRGKFPPHLHLGWYDTDSASDRTSLKSGAMNPYPLLLWLENNGGAVAGGTDAAYCEAPQSPESSADEENSTQSDPGERPDLDTGASNDARPSPVVEEGSHDHSPKQDEKKAPDNAAKAPKKAPTDKPEQPSAAKEDQPAESEESASPPPATENSPKTKVQNTPKTDAEKDSDPEAKEKPEPPDPPEAKEPEPVEKDRPRPHKPKDHAESPTPCDPPQRGAEGRGVRITRDQTDGRKAPIHRDEWLVLIKNDPELRTCKNAGANRKARFEGLAVWTGHPDRDKVRFYLRGGKIVVEDPDEPTLKQARKIADTLDAKVKGSEGKEY